jgi:hypothetical protein
MHKVIAKFECTTKINGLLDTRINFNACTEGEENEKWSEATPAGDISIDVVNEVASFFEVGQDYSVEFSKFKGE